MDDSISRFWDKYIAKKNSYKVPEGARRRYVRHVEGFIQAHSHKRLAAIAAADVTQYLEAIGRKRILKTPKELFFDQSNKTKHHSII